MAWYSLLSFIAFIANILLGFYILNNNPLEKLNRLFALVTFSLAFWAFSVLLLFYAANPVQALLFDRLGTLASSLTCIFLLHFFLVFAKKAVSIRRLFAFYIIPIVYTIIDSTTNLVGKSIKQAPWGYAVEPGILYYLYTFTLAIYIFVSLFYGCRVYLKVKSAKEKKQALLLIIAIFIPLVAGIFIEVIPGFFGIQLFPLTSTFSTITALLITYAIVKYGLMTITPELAAENIITTMTDYLIVTDKENLIRLINPSCLEVLGYQKEELIGNKLQTLFPQDGKLTDLIKQNSPVKSFETNIVLKDGKLIPVSISMSQLHTKISPDAGCVLVAHDMRKSKNLIKDLEEKTLALEKADRELKNTNLDLEEKVKIRTKELEELKDNLEKTIEERTRSKICGIQISAGCRSCRRMDLGS